MSDLRRRRLTGVLALTAVVTLLAACSSPATKPGGNAGGGSGKGDDKTLVIASWGGRFTQTTRDTLAKPFTKDTGIKVQIVDVPGTQVTQLRAQSKAKNTQWDVMDSLSGADAFYLAEEGLIDSLPAETKATYAKALGTKNVSDFGFTYANLGYVIVCADERVKRCPKTVPEFFDTKAYPGKRGLPGTSYSQLTAILGQAAGNPVDHALPIDVDKMLSPLSKIKPSVSVFFTSGDQQEQSLRQGEVDMSVMYSGRAYTMKKQGTDLTINWAGAYDPGYTAITKGAPHKENAQKFLDWVVDHPEAQAEWAKSMQYSVPHPKALEMLPKDVASTLADYPPNYQRLGQQDFEWYLANKAEIDRGIQQIVQGG